MPLSSPIVAPSYELKYDQLMEMYTIHRTEVYGPFPTRDEARQFMVDTQDERRERDRVTP